MPEAGFEDDCGMPSAASAGGGHLGNEGVASSPSSGEGLEIAWSQDVRLEDVLAAAERRSRYLKGEDLPGRGDEPEQKQMGQSDRHELADRPQQPPSEAPGGVAGSGIRAAEVPAHDLAEDPPGEEAIEATLAGAGSTVSLAELAGYALVEPGPGLAGWLSSGDAASMDDAALVNSIVSWRKLTSWAQSQELQAVAELAARRGAAAEQLPHDPVKRLEATFASSEVALALTLTQTGAKFWMDLAVRLTKRLAATFTAFSSGRIDLAKARLIDMFTADLDDELARAVEERVLEKAEEQTTGQLRVALQRAVISVDPPAAERRRKRAERNARVELFGDPEGTGTLSGRNLPAAQAAAAWSRISALAKALESSGAGGGLDLLRAQVFIGLLLGTLPIIPPSANGPGDIGPDYPPEDPDAGSSSDPDTEDLSGPGLEGPCGPGPGNPSGPGPEGPSGPRPVGLEQTDDRRGTTLSQLGETGDWARCRWTDNQAAPSWPQIPDPGTAPTPGCIRDAPDGVPPPFSPWHSGADPPSGKARPPDEARPPHEPKPAGPSVLNDDLLRRAALATRATLTVPLRTLAGLSGEPGQLSRIGPVTADVARCLAEAAAGNRFCEWRVIITDAKGHAIAVTRPVLRPAGTQADRRRADSGSTLAPSWVARITLTLPIGALADGDVRARCSRARAGRVAAILEAALTAADRAAGTNRAASTSGTVSADGHCDREPGEAGPVAGVSASRDCKHDGAVSGYRVPASMRAFLEARDQTCRFPSCRQPAWRSDMDHTIAYHLGGRTCRCNLSAECRYHHKLKQLSDWNLSQPTPGFLVWRTPARLTYAATPDPYPI
jgi:Domain of unknown function (DUF222)